MRGFDPFVMHNAESWSDGIKKYKAEKSRHFFGGEVERPVRITNYFKKREECTINPILQTYSDPQMEKFVQTMEKNNVSRTLNVAYDKQTFFEQKHNIITHQPKVGHVFEVEYKQKLKPPSYVTATHTDFDIISNRKFHDHHWAPEGCRPPRMPTPERKPPFLTAVNKPRDFDITTNMYKEHHADRTKFDAEQTRAMVLDKMDKLRDFDCVKGQYFDNHKEALYQENRRNELLHRGKDHYKNFPPTYQTSEATVYNITSHEIKDAERMQQILQHERRQWEAKAEANIGADEANKIYQTSVAHKEMSRKINRIAHERFRV